MEYSAFLPRLTLLGRGRLGTSQLFPPHRPLHERVYESDIEQALLSAVKTQLNFSLGVKSKIEQQSKSVKQALDDVSVQLKKLSGRLGFLESHKSELFKDYTDGKLSKDKYVEAKEDCLRESEKVKKQIVELESKSNITLSAQNTSDFFNTVKRLSNITEVTADMLSLVDRIDVFDGNRIEIKFNFKDEFERIYSSIKN